MKKQNTCDNCIYYRYDEEYESFVCVNYLDEDEWEKLLKGSYSSCPYFQFDDEYKIVRKQI